MDQRVEDLKKRLFELGVATPYLVADAMAGAFEITIDNLEVVKKARESKTPVSKEEDFIDVEIVGK